MRFTKSKVSILAAVAVMAVGAAGTARASVVYQDSFARGTPANPLALAGTAPDVVDSGGATWSGPSGSSANFYTNGAEATTTTDKNTDNIYTLPFTSASSGISTVSATLTPVAGTTGNWLALAFGDLTGSQPTGGLSLLYRDNGGVDAFYNGAFVAPSATATPGTPDIFTITLNPTADTVNFSDSLGLFGVGGTTETIPSTIFPQVDTVAIDANFVSGTFKNFTATNGTAAVPEPATLGILALGGLAILGKKRRKLA